MLSGVTIDKGEFKMNVTEKLFLAFNFCAVDGWAGASSKPDTGRLLRTGADNGGTSDRRTTEIK
jgi:hypothetical protein